MNELLDPDELPFTRDELARACGLFMPPEEAEFLADHSAALAPDYVATRAARRTEWQAAGIPNAATAPLYGWVYSEELLLALASLSESVAERVEPLMQDRWESMRRAHLNKLAEEAAIAAGLRPSREELIRQLPARARKASAVAVRLPPIPPPTAEMEAQARAVASAEEATFRRAVETYRGRSGEAPRSDAV